MTSKALNAKALWSTTSSLQTIRIVRSHIISPSRLLHEPIFNSLKSSTCRANISSLSKSAQTSIPSPPPPTICKFYTHLRFPRLRHQCRFNSSSTNTTTRTTAASSSTSDANLSLGQRMKKLSKEYGYSALAVYFGLSVLDFPFCFLLVRYVGAETIGKYEHAVVEWFWSVVPDWLYHRQTMPAGADGMGHAEYNNTPLEEIAAQHREMQVRDSNDLNVNMGQEENGKAVGHVQAANQGREGGKRKQVSIWTELALAYAVHKSLIFFRVPLTAAVTPKIVKTLRSWGFNIGVKGGIREGAKKTFPKTNARLVERRALKKETKV